MNDEQCTYCFRAIEGGELCDSCQPVVANQAAEVIINRYCNETGTSRSDAVADILESLMYWCGKGFESELERARWNFKAS